MSSYKANRNGNNSSDSNLSEKERANKNNTNNVRNAADVAIASGNPYAVAAGGVVKAADKLTGGKASEKLGQGMTKAMDRMPGGKKMQDASNKLSESGASNAIGKAAAAKNGTGAAENGLPAGETGAKNISLPKENLLGESGNKGGKLGSSSNDDQDGKSPFEGVGKGTINIKKVVVIILPIIIGFFGVILIIVMTSSIVYGDFEDAIGASDASGESTGDIIYSTSNKEAKEFYSRINDVKLSLQQDGKLVDAIQIVAVYHTLTYYDGSINYKSMTKARLKAIGEDIYDGYNQDDDAYAKNLAESIFKDYFPEYDLEKRTKLGLETITYIRNYSNFIGDYNTGNCSSQGTCSYNIKGVNTGTTVVNKAINGKSIKVRLMNCTDQGLGTPIEGESLVDFEKYILGVVYGELGEGQNTEVYKVQAIVARSFALSRPVTMNGAGGVKIVTEGNQTILQIRNCTEDQVYCDPEQGCSTTVSATEADRTGATIYSGQTTKPITIKRPLAKNSKLRTAVSSVMGEVAVDSNGYVTNIGYQGTVQNRWKTLAESGMDYKQIIISDYSLVSSIAENTCNVNGTTNCAVGVSGPYANWKQFEGSWINITLGDSGQTIKQIGCLATSISMLIAKSGVATIVQGDFNPGSFVEAMNRNNGFVNGGNLSWYAVQRIAPKFKYVNSISVAGKTREAKLNQLKELLNKGYYVVAEVKGDTGQHWVAIDSIVGDRIIMMDPGSRATDMWTQYKWYNTSRFNYFKVG